MSYNNPSIVECVPNFSEGRDQSKIQAIVDVISQINDVKVLHVDIGYDANRTVITFVGTPKGVEAAAFVAIKKASEVIDMRLQKGTHPRLGATDVMPIVPVSGVTMQEAIELSYRLSKRVASELNIPVYNYENSARDVKRRRLEIVRKGEYEGLQEKMSLPDWHPDYGENYNAQSGATIIGARHFLLAYNVNLATKDVGVAKAVAAQIRESGKMKNGTRIAGLFQGVKAIGWDVPEYNLVQVSTNITNTDKVGLHDVYEAVKRTAKEQYKIEIAGSELIGLVPRQCLLESGTFYGGKAASDSEKIDNAVKQLGLNSVESFYPEERIIESLIDS